MMHTADHTDSNLRRHLPPTTWMLKQYAYSLPIGVLGSVSMIFISLDQILFGPKYATTTEFIITPVIGFIFAVYIFKFHLKRLSLGYISTIKANKIMGDSLVLLSLLNLIFTSYMSFFSSHSNNDTYEPLLFIQIPTFIVLLIFSSMPYRYKWYNPHVSSENL